MDTTLVITTLKDVLSHLGVAYDDIAIEELGGSTFFTIKTKDSGVLIGARGDGLSALNHVVKKMLESKLPREAHFTIDVNGYNARKIKSIEDQARLVAERARTFRYDIEMPPMTAYERMIVHSTLKSMSDIDSSSAGEGAMRHIVVRYKDPNAPVAPEANESV
jgi:spoIIIJ-associated protein